jgi:flagellar hook-associated protein 2
MTARKTSARARATATAKTVNDDGTLTYSDSAFTSAINSNFGDVVGFLQNTGSFGATFTTALDGLGNASNTGAVYLAQQQNTSEETALNLNVTNEDTLIASESTSLTTELNTANQIMQSIPSQLSSINEMYSAVTGYNTNTNG